MAANCGLTKCRAYHLTIGEFHKLGGEQWSQAFLVRLGIRARRLYLELYAKPPKQVRQSRIRPDWRNKVGKYPCGILEQALRDLKAEDAGLKQPPEPLRRTSPKPIRAGRKEPQVSLDAPRPAG